MAELGVFLAKQSGTIDQKALAGFATENRAKVSAGLQENIAGLDQKVAVTLQALPGGTDYLPLPKPRSSGARWTATTGKTAANITFGKVSAFIDMLETLEKIFEAGKTGAFEVASQRAPKQNLRFEFATSKFVDDHVANITNDKDEALRKESAATAARRMTKTVEGPSTKEGVPPLVFTTITTSSTMDLHQHKRRKDLEDEIGGRQKEFEAIYQYLTSQGVRDTILQQGDHEEVIFTSIKKFNFYEAVRPADPYTTPTVTKYSENHLRYAVQKVGERWLLHHMAGRAAPDAVATAPTASYQAFNYGNLASIAAVPGTFSKIG